MKNNPEYFISEVKALDIFKFYYLFFIHLFCLFTLTLNFIIPLPHWKHVGLGALPMCHH